MSYLIFSTKCKHSMEVVEYIEKNPQLKQIVKYHDVNRLGIPQQFRTKLDRVPTLLTKNGKLLVGNEIRNWLDSLLPVKDLESCDFGGCGMTTLDGEGTGSHFTLDEYGRSLQPAMTPELEAKINKSVTEAYSNIKK